MSSNERTFIRIVRQAMNTDCAFAFGLAIKLQYVFPSHQPSLEIFKFDDEAKELNWNIYGANEERPTGRVHLLNFSKIGDAAVCVFDSETYLVRFLKEDAEVIDYPKGGPTAEPAFTFEITRK